PCGYCSGLSPCWCPDRLAPRSNRNSDVRFPQEIDRLRRERGFGRERRECRGLAAGFCYKGQKRSTRRQAGQSPHYFTPRILSFLRFITHSLEKILNYLSVRREPWKPEE